MKKDSSTYYIFPIICLCYLLVGCQESGSHNEEGSNDLISPPNIVVILVDDMGYADVGFNGCKDIPTPNIDRIAEQGVVFTNAYVSFPVCGPSRAGLITGRYQDRFGFGRNPLFAPNDSTMGLPIDEATLADVLHQANYKSAAIGKWHLGAHHKQRPLQKGFDDFFGFLSGSHKYFPELLNLEDEYKVQKQYASSRTKLLRNNTRVNETEYLTDAFSREAVNFIEKYQHDPFFIYLAYNAPHTPLQATEKYLSRFDHIKKKKRKTYAAMISSVDDGVGLILDQLNALNLTEKTIVVFLSDNGAPEKLTGSDNGPLRGVKADITEGGIRVPFAMQWPNTIPAGRIFDKPVISLDIFATIVAQNGNHIKLEKPIDGVDLIPYLTNKNQGSPHTQLFWKDFERNVTAIRKNNNKLIMAKDSSSLYNLKNDIGESKDLALGQKQIVQSLSQTYQKWQEEMKDPIFYGIKDEKKYNNLHPNRFKKPFKN